MKLWVWAYFLYGGYSSVVWAHDPIFGIGPHVLFKGGIETNLQLQQQYSSTDVNHAIRLKLTYGLTGDWAVGTEIPVLQKDTKAATAIGLTDIKVFTKYRFWREDTLGQQKSAAVLLVMDWGNGDEAANPSLGSGTKGVLAGLTYGFESIRWYHWASIRYHYPGYTDAAEKQGDRLWLDIVGGWRPNKPLYTRPDTVWLLELNGELESKDIVNGNTVNNSGGIRWFLSPGLFWTLRNFAIKAGIQLPVMHAFNDDQKTKDYRAKISVEWHL